MTVWPAIARRAFEGSHGLASVRLDAEDELAAGLGVSTAAPVVSAPPAAVVGAPAAARRRAGAALAVVAAARSGEQSECEQRGTECAARRDAADEHASISSLPPVCGATPVAPVGADRIAHGERTVVRAAVVTVIHMFESIRVALRDARRPRHP